MPAKPAVSRLDATVVFGAVIFAAGFFLLSAHDARHLDWNAVRLAPTVALLRGLPIYPPEDSGLVTGHIYTPLGALAYAPVAWLHDISTMMGAGSMLALAYFGLPFFWLAKHTVREGCVSTLDATGITVAALLAAALDPALRYAAVMVHAEAPAVGLAGLAIVLAAYARDSRASGWAWSGAFAVGAVLSKQTLLPTWLVLGLTLCGLSGRRAALHYFAGSAAVAGLFAGALTLSGDWRAFIYNCVWLPGHHAWRTADFAFAFGVPSSGQALPDRAHALGKAFLQLAPHWWPAFAVAIWCVLRCLNARPSKEEPLARVALFGAAAAGTQFPLALAAFAKVGGDVNAFAPLLTPLLLMLTALAIGAFTPGSERPIAARRVLIAAVIALVGSNLPRMVFLLETARTRDEPNRRMVAFLRQHPGEVYLPWNPLHTLVAEARRDHFEYGVFDRALAGRPMTAAHYLANLPPRLRWVAVRRNQLPLGRNMFRHYLPGLREAPSPPELQTWVFLEVKASDHSLGLP